MVDVAPPLTRRQLRLERATRQVETPLTRRDIRESAQVNAVRAASPRAVATTPASRANSTPPVFGHKASPPGSKPTSTQPVAPSAGLRQPSRTDAVEPVQPPASPTKAIAKQVASTSAQLPASALTPAHGALHRANRTSLHGITAFTRHNTRPLAAAAAAVMVVGGGLVSGTMHQPPADPTQDALSPLRTTVELVSRRNVSQASSRSMIARLPTQGMDAQLNQADATNATLVLELHLPKLEPGESIVIRRMAGLEPPVTPADGVDVPIADADGVVVDQGLSPDTNYAYTAFLSRPEAKPEVLATALASTTLYPTELAPGDSLVAGERLVSPDHSHYFTVSPEGRAALFNSLGQKIWTFGVDAAPDATVVMQSNGELVVASEGHTMWSSKTTVEGSSLFLTDAGELQILQAGAVLWSSADNGDQLRGGDSPYVVSAQGWTQPASGPFRSPFGGRRHPISGGYRQHEGIDLMGGGRGQPFYAAADGVVETIRCDSGGNWTLVIDHGQGVTTRYLHWDGMSNILVEEGQAVVAGQHVANVGNSGYSTGAHLHFEVRRNDQATDPVAFLKEHGVQPIW